MSLRDEILRNAAAQVRDELSPLTPERLIADSERFVQENSRDIAGLTGLLRVFQSWHELTLSTLGAPMAVPQEPPVPAPPAPDTLPSAAPAPEPSAHAARPPRPVRTKRLVLLGEPTNPDPASEGITPAPDPTAPPEPRTPTAPPIPPELDDELTAALAAEGAPV